MIASHTRKVSLANILTILVMIGSVIASATILYGKIESTIKSQEVINQNFKDTDERHELKQKDLDEKMTAILESQARIEGALGIPEQKRKQRK